MDMSGIYTYDDCNGYIDVLQCGSNLYCQRFIVGSSNNRISVGNEFVLNELPSNWVKVKMWGWQKINLMVNYKCS